MQNNLRVFTNTCLMAVVITIIIMFLSCKATKISYVVPFNRYTNLWTNIQIYKESFKKQYAIKHYTVKEGNKAIIGQTIW